MLGGQLSWRHCDVSVILSLDQPFHFVLTPWSFGLADYIRAHNDAITLLLFFPFDDVASVTFEDGRHNHVTGRVLETNDPPQRDKWDDLEGRGSEGQNDPFLLLTPPCPLWAPLSFLLLVA